MDILNVLQVKQEHVKVLTVKVIKATGVSVGGFFGDCKFIVSKQN